MLGAGGLAGTGNALANAISGGSGDDTLNGAGGADRLEGGRGRDVLTGGGDADVFAFAAKDTSAQAATADLVTDFSQADGDRIDLSSIDADASAPGVQHFSFVGTAAFAHTAGELRYDAGKKGPFVSVTRMATARRT